MVFAIEEINENATLIPNIKLGFVVRDTCDATAKALESTIQLLSAQEEAIPNFHCESQTPVIAIIGDDKSKLSISMGRLLGLQRFPQISYASSVKILSDKIQFPSFLRTTPTDDFQSYGLARLINHYQWTCIGMLAEDTAYGHQGANVLSEELKKVNVCIDFLAVIPTFTSSNRIGHIVKMVIGSTARVIIVFSSDVLFYPVMEAVARSNVTGKVWVGCDGWASSLLFNKKEFVDYMHGSLGFTIRRGNMRGFEDFLSKLHPRRVPDDVFVIKFWENTFKCQWPGLAKGVTESVLSQEQPRWCTGEENLRDLHIPFLDMSDLRATFNVYNAIYAVAHALKEIGSCEPGQGPFKNRTCADIKNFKPWQVLYYIKRVHFTNNMGEQVFFDTKGNQPVTFDVINWKMSPGRNSLEYVNVGCFDPTASRGQDLTLKEESIEWNGGSSKRPRSICSESCPPGFRKAPRRGKSTCCFDCVLCSEGEISNETDSTECRRCPEDYWPNNNQDQCVRKDVEFLSYEEPLGQFMTATALIIALVPATILVIFAKFRHTPMVKANNRELSYLLLTALILCVLCSLLFIGHPKNLTCLLRQATFGIIFVFGISCVLAKTIMVVLAFRATRPGSRLKRWFDARLSKSIVASGTLIQVMICTAWLAISPPFLEKNTKSKTAKIILECNQGSAVAFWCMLGYMGMLASASFVVAFLARKLPDCFNEAKFITFSMLVFVTVWLSFIPAYISTQGKYMVAVEIFAMLASSAGLVACIFFPKCYIILIRPERNTRDYLMRKKDAKRLKKKRR